MIQNRHPCYWNFMTIKVDWTLFTHEFNVRIPPLDAPKDPQVQPWLKDAIQPLNDPLKVLVGPVTRLKVKKFKEAFNGLIKDIRAKVDFKRICNNKEQALINLIHLQEGLVGGTKTITQGLGEKD